MLQISISVIRYREVCFNGRVIRLLSTDESTVTMENVIRVSRSVSMPRTLRLADLHVGVAYPILAMRNVRSHFRKGVVCDIFTCHDGKDIFSVYLPNRFNVVYSDIDLDKILPCRLSLTLVRKVTLLNGKETFEIDIDYYTPPTTLMTK